MKVPLLSAIALAAMAAQNLSYAGPVQDVAKEVQTQGWFKSCNQVLPKLAAIAEPSQKSPEWKTYITLKAGCLSELRRDAEAIAYINKKVPAAKRDSDINEYLGTSYIRLGSYDKATETLEASLAGADKSRLAEIYSKLALTYTQQATQLNATEQTMALSKAEAAARNAIKLGKTGAPQFYAQLGQIQTFKGDFIAAERSLNKALTANESFQWEKPELRPIMEVEILMAKSHVRRYQGDEAGADSLAEEAIQKSPTESLKIAMQQIHKAARPDSALRQKSQEASTDETSVLNQVYIPLDEEI